MKESDIDLKESAHVTVHKTMEFYSRTSLER